MEHQTGSIPPNPASRWGVAWLSLLVVGLLAGLAAGCDVLDLATLEPTATRPAAPTATAPPSPTPAAAISNTRRITLTLWYPEHLAPARDQPGGAVLAEQYEAFAEMYPDVHVAGSRFKASGAGGLLDYVLTTSKVLPHDLPDLVLLNLRDLPRAAGLLQPLDDLWESEPWSDWFSGPQQQSRIEGRAVAIPYEMDVRLLVYDSEVVSEVPPAWADGMTWPAPYLLPLGGGEAAAEALLLQYVAVGVGSVDDEARLALDEGALAEALEYYRARHEQEQFHTAALTTTNLAECWELFVGGQADLTETTAHLVLSAKEGRETARCAPIPTRSGTPVAVVDGWAWAILTDDDYRQQAALALISWLMEEENLAARCVASGYLPSRQGAMAYMGESPCLPAGALLLDLAPVGLEALQAGVAPRFHAALQDVLSGNQSSAQAAAAVIAAIKRWQNEQPGGD